MRPALLLIIAALVGCVAAANKAANSNLLCKVEKNEINPQLLEGSDMLSAAKFARSCHPPALFWKPKLIGRLLQKTFSKGQSVTAEDVSAAIFVLSTADFGPGLKLFDLTKVQLSPIQMFAFVKMATYSVVLSNPSRTAKIEHYITVDIVHAVAIAAGALARLNYLPPDLPPRKQIKVFLEQHNHRNGPSALVISRSDMTEKNLAQIFIIFKSDFGFPICISHDLYLYGVANLPSDVLPETYGVVCEKTDNQNARLTVNEISIGLDVAVVARRIMELQDLHNYGGFGGPAADALIKYFTTEPSIDPLVREKMLRWFEDCKALQNLAAGQKAVW